MNKKIILNALVLFTLISPFVDLFFGNRVTALKTDYSYEYAGVLGQLNATSSYEFGVREGANNSNFADPYAFAVDTQRHKLFVADGGQSSLNRILVFNLDNNNELIDKTADFVLGQPDFETSNLDGCGPWGGTISASRLCQPYGLAIDVARGLLFTSDAFNNRVLVFDINSITTGEDAVYVIGQANFTTGTCNLGEPDFIPSVSTMCQPWGIAYDADNSRLFVSERENDRILVFDVGSEDLANNIPATNVLGQPNFDVNGCNQNSGSPFANTMCEPYALDFDVFNQRLFVSDYYNNRILIYSNVGPANILNNMNADIVLGQADFESSACQTSQTGLCNPIGISYDTGPINEGDSARLFVSDGNNNRVLVFDASPANLSNNDSSVLVLGQQDFQSSLCNAGVGVQANNFCYPRGVIFIPALQKLMVGDLSNSRILIFDADPSILQSNDDSIDVIGQPSSTSNFLYGIQKPNNIGFDSVKDVAIDTLAHRAYAIDRNLSRILIYNLDEDNLPIDQYADYVIGQPDLFSGEASESCANPTSQNLCEPLSLELDVQGRRLFVSDTRNRRIVIYDISTLSNNLQAVRVLGSTSFEERLTCANENNEYLSNRICNPGTLTYDPVADRLYIYDNSASRILVFEVGDSIADITNDMNRLLYIRWLSLW